MKEQQKKQLENDVNKIVEYFNPHMLKEELEKYLLLNVFKKDGDLFEEKKRIIKVLEIDDPCQKERIGRIEAYEIVKNAFDKIQDLTGQRTDIGFYTTAAKIVSLLILVNKNDKNL